MLTGAVSSRTPSWTADHVVAGHTLLPGTAFVDLALHAGAVVGLPELAELTIEAPLDLSAEPSRLQVAVGPLEADGRSLVIRSRAGDADWIRHATGRLTGPSAPAPDRLDAWPPPAAESVPLDDVRARLAVLGYDYGPAFRGLTAAGRDGSSWCGEATLPSMISGAGHVVHPALLDAVLHLLVLGTDPHDVTPRLPFAWSGVAVHRPMPDSVRVRLSPSGPESISLLVADETGRPVLTVQALTLRQITARSGGLYELAWRPVPLAGPGLDDDYEVLDLSAPSRDDVPGAARALAAEVLDRLRSGRRLAVVTRRAVAVSPHEDVRDLAAATVWGLVRAAQAEQPHRFVLIDTDEPTSVREAVASGREQLALRGGIAYTPRLTPSTARTGPEPRLAGATVLITGGAGALGRIVARHLVDRHGVGKVILAGRRELVDADVEYVACDVTDARQVDALFAARSIDVVVHAAGVLDDSTVERMNAAQLRRVLAPKVDGAWQLHRATLDRPLRAFVLFSSAAGLLGNAGQAGYAAANAFLDALAAYRRAAGLPAISLAWGPWRTGMAADRGRVGTGELVGMAAEDALALLDTALATDRAVLAPLTPNLAALRQRDAAGLLRDALRELVPARPATVGERVAESLTERLDALPDHEQRAALVADLVTDHVAAVLGLAADQVQPRKPFKDTGFDSLAAVELRNRIASATGVRLPATAVFDFPTPDALTEELVARLRRPDPSLDDELNRLAARLAAFDGDPDRRAALSGRLHRLAESLGPAGAGEPSLDEVFALIDGLGRRTAEGDAPA